MEWRRQGDHAKAEARNPRIEKVISPRTPCLPGLKGTGQFTHATLALFEPNREYPTASHLETRGTVQLFWLRFPHSGD